MTALGRRARGLALHPSRRVRRLVAALGLLLAAGLLVWPFFEARYPPLTDLPYHAANASIIGHFFDPDYGFREQFALNFLEAPYSLMYLVGAALMQVMPTVAAAKGMVLAMLAALPLGLALFFRGAKKSPWLGLLALPLTWGGLTHWGFVSFLGAIGLFAAVIGATLLLVERPTLWRRAALALLLIALFFTHVFRFPFGVGASVLAALAVWPVTRRFFVILPSLAPPLLLFGVWSVVRPYVLAPELVPELTFEPDRLGELLPAPFGAFRGEAGDEERVAAGLSGVAWLLLLGVSSVYAWRRARGASRDERRWMLGVTLLPLAVVLGLLVGYVTLPLSVQHWFLIWPREATAVLFVLLAVTPDLPPVPWLRASLVGLVLAAYANQTALVAREWRDFDATNEDFMAITELLPRNPKLVHLVFEHNDTNRTQSPFMHLPAWVQAEKGGALAFHFARWRIYPVRYRHGNPAVPPRWPLGMEWHPDQFRAAEHGAWFDWFLVRHRVDPSVFMKSDPAVRLEAHIGKWWLYRRERDEAVPEARPLPESAVPAPSPEGR